MGRRPRRSLLILVGLFLLLNFACAQENPPDVQEVSKENVESKEAEMGRVVKLDAPVQKQIVLKDEEYRAVHIKEDIVPDVPIESVEVIKDVKAINVKSGAYSLDDTVPNFRSSNIEEGYGNYILYDILL